MTDRVPEFDEKGADNKRPNPLLDEFTADIGSRPSASRAVAAPASRPTDRMPSIPDKKLPDVGPPVPVVAEGKFIVKNEAEIVTSKDGKVSLSRTDGKKTGFELTPTKNGAIKYDHRGPQNSDNYTYTITPDGKGGNNVQWQMNNGKDNKTRVEGSYHWAPQAQVRGTPGKGLTDTMKSDNSVLAQTDDGIDNKQEHAAIGGSEERTILDNGQGTRLNRFRFDKSTGSGKKEEQISFKVKTSDSQGNVINIDENGHLSIQNPKLGQYIFQPESNGYSMLSTGPTEDGIASQSLIDGIGSTSIVRDGMTVTKSTDGSSAITKFDSSGLSTSWSTFKDGTKVTTRLGTQGGASKWITPSYYPKDGSMYMNDNPDFAHKLPDGQIPRIISIRDSENVSPLASQRRGEVEDKQNVIIRDSIKSKEYSARPATLAETNTLDMGLQKFPSDPEDESLSFVFLDGKSYGNISTQGFYRSSERSITINPTASRERLLQYDSDYRTAGTLESLIDHELAHDWTYRLDPKGWDSGELETELGNIFAMHEITDVTDHNQRWIVEGETVKGKTLYYKQAKEKGPWQRCDLDGNLVDSSGNKVDPTKEIELIDDLNPYAKVKLPSQYAYTNPIEAAAELLTMHGINEASRIHYLQKTDAKAREWAEKADEKIINASKSKRPEGWIRLPSGDIVPKNKENEQLVLTFNDKYTPKETK